MLYFKIYQTKKIKGNIVKNDSKLDFEYKIVPQIQSNAKVTQKTSKITKEDFLGSLLYRRHLEKSSFVNIDILLNLKNSQKFQRRFFEKSSRINMLVLQLTEVCQKFEFL